MILHSYRAGNSRNMWKDIDHGKIIVITPYKHEKCIYKVRNNIITEVVKAVKEIKTHTKYGHWEKTYKNNKLIGIEHFRPRSNCARIVNGIWKKCNGKLDNFDVKIIQKCYGGGFRKEKVVYKNSKQLAYDVYYGKKNLTLYYPDGKPWAIFQGENDTTINFAWKSSILCLIENYRQRDNTNSLVEPTDYSYDHLFNGGNYTVVVFDKKGKTKIKGKSEHRQKIGEWLENYENVYYLSGVKVSKRMFFAKPEDLDPLEVLEMENIQLRTSLLNRIGLEKVIQKVKGNVIDKQGDYELISIPIKKAEWSLDTTLNILKVKCPSTGVYYTLRVPPDVVNCEQARQWTFGVESPNATKDTNWLELVDET